MLSKLVNTDVASEALEMNAMLMCDQGNIDGAIQELYSYYITSAVMIHYACVHMYQYITTHVIVLIHIYTIFVSIL